MKTLGILGGVGPQTTSKVYLSVIERVRVGKKINYPPIVIYNLPFPFLIEDEAIIQGINSEKMIPYLIDGAKILEKSGADFGILPCNTLHKYMVEICESVKIPFLSILDETANELERLNIKTVGILATKTTVESDIYGEVLKKRGIDIFYPSESEQNDISSIIIELISGNENDVHSNKIQSICNSLKDRGVTGILLACTDLQLAISNVKSPVPIIDTTEVLIQATVRELIS